MTKPLVPSAICLLALLACNSPASIDRVGLCVQYEGPAPHISTAIVVLPSNKPKWDRDISKDIVGLQVPAPITYWPGTWIPTMIERERSGWWKPAASTEAITVKVGSEHYFNCDQLNRPAP